jgi:cytochrome c peroxidase
MKKEMERQTRKRIFMALTILLALLAISFRHRADTGAYILYYTSGLDVFMQQEGVLQKAIGKSDLKNPEDIKMLRMEIAAARGKMKSMDFWLRYLEPTIYKQVNGPLPVEWETEVFEKFEKPYKREGAGLTLAWLYLEEENPEKDTLLKLLEPALQATKKYSSDSITQVLKDYHHFFLCNRLYLLNLAAIYTTGFECPDTAAVIPELRQMMKDVSTIYMTFNESHPATQVNGEFLELYGRLLDFTGGQSSHYSSFDHYSFIRDYVNPLFALNQKMIIEYKVKSSSVVDYSLSKSSTSIFSKSLYNGQNSKGIFLRVTDEKALSEIDRLGKLLFYDPLLSGNNQRSCASCHKPDEFFTDTMTSTSPRFDHKGFLARNTPSLINVGYNHLVMLDGKHISLQHQTRGVIGNTVEMGSDERECLKKILSCRDYKKGFQKLLKYTPQETEVTFEHVISAITFYYGKFGNYEAPFDMAVNTAHHLNADAMEGFNLFMSKAQCATCHFVPHFNGVKPPYVASEFEVIGVPGDTAYTKLSEDKGRYEVNPAFETMHAFRTGTVRNITHTAPYMHNGVFHSLMQVIDFYNAGGGAGKGLRVENQTLSADSLGLSYPEKLKLIAFLRSLDEKIIFETAPAFLPVSSDKALNRRKVGGEY